MSKRSAAWEKEKSRLERREVQIREDLEVVSSDFETKVKNVLKVTLITGGVFLAGYGLYRMLSPSRKEESAPQKSRKEEITEVKVKPRFSLKSLIFEKLAIAIIGFIGSQLTTLLSKNLSDQKEEDD